MLKVITVVSNKNAWKCLAFFAGNNSSVNKNMLDKVELWMKFEKKKKKNLQ